MRFTQTAPDNSEQSNAYDGFVLTGADVYYLRMLAWYEINCRRCRRWRRRRRHVVNNIRRRKQKQKTNKNTNDTTLCVRSQFDSVTHLNSLRSHHSFLLWFATSVYHRQWSLYAVHSVHFLPPGSGGVQSTCWFTLVGILVPKNCKKKNKITTKIVRKAAITYLKAKPISIICMRTTRSVCAALFSYFITFNGVSDKVTILQTRWSAPCAYIFFFALVHVKHTTDCQIGTFRAFTRIELSFSIISARMYDIMVSSITN